VALVSGNDNTLNLVSCCAEKPCWTGVVRAAEESEECNKNLK